MDLPPLIPDHYYDLDPHYQTSTSSDEYVPVFKPSFEEFKDFTSFVSRILPYGSKSSIVKVIPPKEWVESLPDISKELEKVRITSAIEQHFFGSRGVFMQTNIESRREYTVEEFRVVAEGESLRTPKVQALAKPDLSSKKGKLSPESINSEISEQKVPDTNLESADGLQATCEAEDWSVDRCKELERYYWRNLTYAPPMYGADLDGTLFGDKLHIWNPANLGDLLTQLPNPVPGVNTPYLYFGMWKASFAWHVEDMDLFSINYIHFGAPKQWYSIPAKYRDRFEQLAKNTFPQESKQCPEFLRHKTFVLSPNMLSGNSIPVGRLVQRAGEFVLTFPRGYHSGYNLGFNCAESVNFATKEWLNVGKKARRCMCISDSVSIDVARIQNMLGVSTKSDEGQTEVPKEKIVQNPEARKKRKITHFNPPYLVEHGRPPECCLCALSGGVLLPVQLHTKDKSTNIYAHRVCAMYIPETRILTQKEFIKESGLIGSDQELGECADEDVVAGVAEIPQGRWELIKRGAPALCASEKCLKAYHVTCAQKAGLCLCGIAEESVTLNVSMSLNPKITEALMKARNVDMTSADLPASLPITKKTESFLHIVYCEQHHPLKNISSNDIQCGEHVIVKEKDGRDLYGVVIERHNDNCLSVQFDKGHTQRISSDQVRVDDEQEHIEIV